jgi:endothelin-converting enzyme/putative endopeptidase
MGNEELLGGMLRKDTPHAPPLRVGLPRLAATALAVFLVAACGGEDAPTPPLARSGIDTTFLDRSTDPCVDFYQFACGGWIDDHPITPDAAVRSRAQEPFYAAVPLLWEIVEADADGAVSADDPHARLIGDYYTSCLTAPSTPAAREQLRTLVAAIDAVETLEDVATQAAAQRALGSGTFFRPFVVIDPADTTRYVLAVDQGGAELDDRSYYLDAEYEPLRAKYRDHIASLSTLVTGSPIDVDAVLHVETALATAMLPRDERRDPESLYHPMSGAALAELAPSFAWATFWEASGYEVPEVVNVLVPDFFVALEELLSTAPIEDLRAYMRWQLIQDRAADLDQAVLDQDFAFWSTFTGQQEAHPREWTCFVATQSTFGLALAQPYVSRYFDEDARLVAEDLAGELKAAFGARIAEASWADAATRGEAAEKLGAVAFKLAYPDQWPDYGGLALTPASYFDNRSTLSAYGLEEMRARIGAPVDRTEWSGSPLAVNAWYSPQLNDVTVTALRLTPPLVPAGAPLATHAGAVGVLLGHELSHGFDDWGRHYDGAGNLRNWWSAEAETSFGERAQCLVDQFDGYEALPGEWVNGELTVGENIADLVGIATAHRALVDGPEVEGGDGFSAEQVFFIAYAQTRCENARPEWTAARLVTDPHAPPKLRVNGPLANLPEFSSAFGCAAGSPMVRATPCRVW